MTAKYFNPYTDFGFKKLFGEEGSKDLLINFLNQLLPAHHQIASLSFKNPENLNDTAYENYHKSLLEYWEVKNVKDTAFNEGKLEGNAEGKIERTIEVAKALKQQGVAIDIIITTTGLTRQEIEGL